LAQTSAETEQQELAGMEDIVDTLGQMSTDQLTEVTEMLSGINEGLSFA